MRIGLLEIDQDPSETPKRLISKRKASLLTDRGYAKWLNKSTVQMVRAEQMIQLDYRYYKNADEPAWIPFLKVRDWHQGLLLTYPHKSQESWL